MCGGCRVRCVPRPLPGNLQVFGDPVWVCPLQWVLIPLHLFPPPHPPLTPFTTLPIPPSNLTWTSYPLFNTPKILRNRQHTHMYTKDKNKMDNHFHLLSLSLCYTAYDHGALNLFSPSTEWRTSSWGGFSQEGRCFTNTGPDKHFVHTHWKHGVSPYWQSQQCNTHCPALMHWLTQGHAIAFICSQTPLLSLWFQ